MDIEEAAEYRYTDEKADSRCDALDLIQCDIGKEQGDNLI